jgi:hypothetical protein
VLHGFGDSEIGQLEHALVIDEDVLGFDVAVDDLVVVEVVQALDKLDEPVHDKFLF